jgi:hypothetical protein
MCGASLGMRPTFLRPTNTVDLVMTIFLRTYPSLAFSITIDFTYGTEARERQVDYLSSADLFRLMRYTDH